MMTKSGGPAPLVALQAQQGEIGNIPAAYFAVKVLWVHCSRLHRHLDQLDDWAPHAWSLWLMLRSFFGGIHREYSPPVLVSYSFLPDPFSSEAKSSPTAVTVPQNVSFWPLPGSEGSGSLLTPMETFWGTVTAVGEDLASLEKGSGRKE